MESVMEHHGSYESVEFSIVLVSTLVSASLPTLKGIPESIRIVGAGAGVCAQGLGARVRRDALLVRLLVNRLLITVAATGRHSFGGWMCQQDA